MSLKFEGIHAAFMVDDTPEIDLEGSLSCGKTIACLWKELEALRKYPGMNSYIGRWTDDATMTLLRPELERVARIHGTELDWNEKRKWYELDNGCHIYSFGLKTLSQEPEQRYGKIRGLPVSRIYVDQAEQLPGDIASELRARLRPDIEAQVRKESYPRQLTFSPNPVDTDHWLAKQFPADNRIKNRRYYSLSMYDNAHNLPPEMIEQMLIEYPEDHPKHQTVILGRRGPNIIGDPIFDSIYRKTLHQKPVRLRAVPIYEAFEVGKHNPVWLCAQPRYGGGLTLLGGVFGEGMMLDDFIPIVQQRRADWFKGREFKTCAGPQGDKSTASKARFTSLSILRQAGFDVVWRDNANAHDVRLAMIECISGYMRRRDHAGNEMFQLNDDPTKWLKANRDEETPYPFAHYALDGGYVWSEHFVSVSSNKLRQPLEDDRFANAMHCVENIALNFMADQKSEAERDQKRAEEAERLGNAFALPTGPNAWLAW